MTVSTESSLTSYSGDGTTTAFATGFPFFDEEDLVVVVEATSTNAPTVQVLGSDYSVTGGQVDDGSPQTGTVTMNAAPESGETLHIYRASGYTQGVNLIDNTAQRATVTESSLDRLATYVQEMDHRLDRAVRLPEIGAAVDALDGAYPRRETVIGFDEDGALTLIAQSDLGGDGGSGGGAVWGGISGTLSDQTDLQSALNTKASVTLFNNHVNDVSNPHDLSWGQILGTLSDQTDLQAALDAKADVGATVAWGDVTGTLADQTDLQTALDAKLEDVSLGDIDASGSPTDGDFLTVSGGGLSWASEVAGSIYSTTQPGVESAGTALLQVGFASDGSMLVGAGAESPGFVAYDTSDWSLVSSTPTYSSANGAAISPDGTRVAVSTPSGTDIYNASTWAQVGSTLTDAAGGGRCVYSPNGSYLAVVTGISPYLVVFDTSDWSTVSGTPTLDGVGNDCAFTADSSRLAVAHEGSPYLTVLDTSDWSTVSGTPTVAGAANGCAYAASGDYLAVAHDTSPYLSVYDTSDWSTVSGTPTLDGFGRGCAFSADGDYLAVVHSGAPYFTLVATSSWAAVSGTFEPSDFAFDCDFDSGGDLAIGRRPNSTGLSVVRQEPTEAVTSVNGQTGDVTLTTSNIAEGSNEYHTDARAVAAIKADADWNATDWDTAFGWGNHASAGYLEDVDAADLNSTNSPADGQVPTYDQTSGGFTWSTAGSGSGASSFTDLDDTPGSYTGFDGYIPMVDGSSLAFVKDIGALEVELDATGAPVARALEDRFTDTVHVKDFGAVGNGVTDDAPAIQSAIDSGASRILLGATHRINSTIEIRRSGVHIQGTGIHPLEASSSGDDSTTLTWGGSAGGTMFYVSPAAAPNNQLITGVRVEGITLDGDDSAARGWVLESCRWCRFYISAGNCTEYQIITGCAFETSGPNRDFQWNECTFFARATGSADGVFITARGHEDGADSGQQGNSSLNTFHYIDVRADDGIGVDIGSADNNYYGHIRVFSYGTPTHQIRFRGERTVGAHTEGRARQEWLERCAVRSGLAAGITIEGTDAAGVTQAAETIRLTIDKDNSVPEPDVGTGASVRYDRGDGVLVGWGHRGVGIGDSNTHTVAAMEDRGLEAMRVQAGNGIWGAFSDFNSNTVVQLRTDGTNRARFRFPTTDGTERFRINAPMHVVSLTETSDIALKDNVEDFYGGEALAAIRNLQPRTFNWKADGAPDVGLIAQEVQKVLPNVVEGGDEDDDAPMGVKYTKLVTYLVGAVQELADALANRHGRL